MRESYQITRSRPVPARPPKPLAVVSNRQRVSRWFLLATFSTVGLAIIVRAVHVLSQDFPLNDGALFYAMVQDLLNASFHLPAYTSYNNAQIPFSYSPLSFYVAAFLHASTGVSLVELFRWLPLIATSLTVPAFFLLARSLIPSRRTVIVATVAFGLLPRSFIWLLMGGGLTRSFGFLFAILTLYALHRLYVRRHWPYALLAMGCAALTILSHLGTVPFVLFSSVLFFLFRGRNRYGIISSGLMALGTALITAPWWLTIVMTHGLAPFLAARNTSSSLFSPGTWRHIPAALAHNGFGTSEPILPLIGGLALLGMCFAISQRRYLLPLWWGLILVLDTRAGTTYASVPIAMLAAIGINEVLIPLFNRQQAPVVLIEQQQSQPRAAWIGKAARRPMRYSLLSLSAIGLFLSFSTVSAVTSSPALTGELRYLASLSDEERAAMQWVALETPASSTFLVITGSGWEVDKVSEWFPVLAERVSVATVQGYEWLPKGAFAEQRDFYNRAQWCANADAECLETWFQETGKSATYLFIARSPTNPCCGALFLSLQEDSRYRAVYDGPGAAIFVRIGEEQAALPPIMAQNVLEQNQVSPTCWLRRSSHGLSQV